MFFRRMVVLSLSTPHIELLSRTFVEAVVPGIGDDVVAAVRDVLRDSPNGVILGGARAGACLSAGAVLRLVDGGADALVGAFFAYGFVTRRCRNGRASCVDACVAGGASGMRRSCSTS